MVTQADRSIGPWFLMIQCCSFHSALLFSTRPCFFSFLPLNIQIAISFFYRVSLLNANTRTSVANLCLHLYKTYLDLFYTTLSDALKHETTDTVPTLCASFERHNFCSR